MENVEMINPNMSLEMIFLNWAERITVDHITFLDFLDRRYVSKKREFTVLKAYGWHDYVIVAKDPIYLGQMITDEGWDCVESSILGWILDLDSIDEQESQQHYLAIVKRIRDIIPQLKPRSATDKPKLYVLSLICLNKECSGRYIDLKNYIEDGEIIHCVGIWDIALIVKIKDSGNVTQNIEGYKRKFLYSDYVKRSSSTILVGLTRDEIKQIKSSYKIKELAKLIGDKVKSIWKELKNIDEDLVEFIEKINIVDKLFEMTKNETTNDILKISESMINKFIELIEDKNRTFKLDNKVKNVIKEKLKPTNDEINKIKDDYENFNKMFKESLENLLRGD